MTPWIRPSTGCAGQPVERVDEHLHALVRSDGSEVSDAQRGDACLCGASAEPRQVLPVARHARCGPRGTNPDATNVRRRNSLGARKRSTCASASRIVRSRSAISRGARGRASTGVRVADRRAPLDAGPDLLERSRQHPRESAADPLGAARQGPRLDEPRRHALGALPGLGQVAALEVGLAAAGRPARRAACTRAACRRSGCRGAPRGARIPTPKNFVCWTWTTSGRNRSRTSSNRASMRGVLVRRPEVGQGGVVHDLGERDAVVRSRGGPRTAGAPGGSRRRRARRRGALRAPSRADRCRPPSRPRGTAGSRG